MALSCWRSRKHFSGTFRHCVLSVCLPGPLIYLASSLDFKVLSLKTLLLRAEPSFIFQKTANSLYKSKNPSMLMHGEQLVLANQNAELNGEKCRNCSCDLWQKSLLWLVSCRKFPLPYSPPTLDVYRDYIEYHLNVIQIFATAWFSEQTKIYFCHTIVWPQRGNGPVL